MVGCWRSRGGRRTRGHPRTRGRSRAPSRRRTPDSRRRRDPRSRYRLGGPIQSRQRPSRPAPSRPAPPKIGPEPTGPEPTGPGSISPGSVCGWLSCPGAVRGPPSGSGSRPSGPACPEFFGVGDTEGGEPGVGSSGRAESLSPPGPVPRCPKARLPPAVRAPAPLVRTYFFQGRAGRTVPRVGDGRAGLRHGMTKAPAPWGRRGPSY